MNHIYRLCWNRALRAWVPASELAKGMGMAESGRRSMARVPLMLSLLSVSLGMSGLAWAGNSPSGGRIVSGSGLITQSGNLTTIRQNSQSLSLNWQSFDVGAGQTVDFLQPGRDSIAVNRILGNTASDIEGHLNANGQVWLINPNGVLFGKDAQVNVGGIVASTLDVDQGTPGNGIVGFAGNGKGSVVNLGTITVTPGGYAALLGNTVSNQGTIRAQLGTVALAGGTAMTLTFADNHLMHLVVDANAVKSLVENRQLIVADGGQVLMTAGARNSLIDSAVNNTGTVQAQTVQNHNGTITLLGGMEAGTVNVAGTLDASAPQGGKGGFIETSGAHVHIADGSVITTKAAQNGQSGTWLVDPADFTIAASGGDITATQLASNLASGNVTLTSAQGTVNTSGSGNVNVNQAVTWSANTTLTLTASNNVNLNAAITNTGTSGKTVLNATNAFVNNVGAAGLKGNWAIYSASPTATGEKLNGLTPGFIQYNAPIGTAAASGATGNGLFYANAASINITGLANASKIYDGTSNLLVSQLTDTLSGGSSGDTLTAITGGYSQSDVGTGLKITAPTASSAYTIVNGSVPVYGYTVSGASSANSNAGAITAAQLYATIVGDPTKVYDGTTTATLTSANYYISGLVAGQSITVNQPSSVGYASADVNTNNGTTPAGGLVAVNATFASTNFSAGSGTKLSNYILPTTTSTTAAALATDATAGYGTITPAPVYLSGVLATSKTYDASASDPLNTSNASIYGVVNGDAVTLDSTNGTGSFASPNAGNNLAVALTGFTLDGNATKVADYKLITPTNLTADIYQKALTVTGVTTASKTYDGTTSAALNTGSAVLSGFVNTADQTSTQLTGSAQGNFSQSDVGSNLAVTVSGLTVNNSNYTVTQPTDLVANITPASLTIAFNPNVSPDKVYDGTDYATLNGTDFTVQGLVGSEKVSVSQAPATYTGSGAPNVGTYDVTASLQSSDLSFSNGAKAGNYTFNTSVTGTGNINQAPLELVINGNPSKTYDGTSSASLTAGNFMLSGVIPGETINLVGPFTANYYNASPSTPESNVGTWGVAAALTSDNYQFTASNGNPTGSLGNYILPTTALGFGTITPKGIGSQITAGTNGATKVYDGNTSITLGQSNIVFYGFVNGDGGTVTAPITGTFATKNVGTQPLSALLNSSNVSFTCGGGGTACLSNYTYDSTPGDTLAQSNWAITAYGSGVIQQKNLYVTLSGVTKQYDGNTTVLTLGNGNFNVYGYTGNDTGGTKDSGWVSGEGATITPTATFAYGSPNVARDASGNVLGNIEVKGSLTYQNYTPNANTQLSNYNLVYSIDQDVGTITPAPLYVSGVTAQNKIYDGGNGALIDISNGQLAGLADVDKNASAITLDIGNATASSADGNNSSTGGTIVANSNGTFTASNSPVGGTFASANAGNNQAVTTTITLSGSSAGNYTLETPTFTANLAPRPLTVSGVTANNKTYDGTAAATFTFTSPTFNQASGTGTAASGLLAQDASNVSLNQSSGTGTFATANANMTPGALDANGNPYSPGAATGAGTWLSANGQPITVTASGFTLSGNAAGNYVLNQPTGLSADIAQRQITATLDGPLTKAYDGTSSITIPVAKYSSSGWITGQNATIVQTQSAYYGDPGQPQSNAGTYDVTANLVSSDWKPSAGTSLSNYALPTQVVGNQVGTITPLVLNLSATRVYDATTNIYSSLSGNVTNADNANAFGTLNGINGDQFTVSGTGAMSAKDVGTYSGTGLSGQPTSGQGFNLGTLALVAIGSANTGNYTLVGGTDTYTITQAPLNITGATVTPKTYNATTAATVTGATVTQGTSAGDVLGSDTVTISNSNAPGTFASPNANTGLTGTSSTPTAVTINGAAITGTDAKDYYIVQPTGLAGTINQAPVTINGVRQYSGSTAAAVASGTTWTISGTVGTQKLTVTNGTGSGGTVTSANVGTYTDTGSTFNLGTLALGNGSNGGLASNYGIASSGNQFVINPYQVNLTGSSIYNGTATAGATSSSFNGVSITDGSFSTGINGETLDLGGSYALANNGNVTPNGSGGGTANKQTTTTPTTSGAGLGGLTLADGSGAANNYVINSVTYTVNPVVLSFSGSKTYDGSSSFAASTLGALTGGFVGSDQVTVSGTGVLSSANAGNYGTGASGILGTPSSTATIGVGGLALTGVGATNANNYTLIGGSDTYTITSKQVTITGIRQYDGKVDANGSGNILLSTSSTCTAGTTCWVVNGMVAGDQTKLSVGGSGSVSSANVGNYADSASTGNVFTSNVGNGGLSLGGSASGNYTLATTGNTFIINPAALTVTANNASKTYDGLAYSGGNGVSYSGFVNGETASVLGGSVAYGGSSQGAVNAGSYGITASGLSSNNYTISYVAGALDVGRAILNLSGTRVYDAGTDASGNVFGNNGVIDTGINGEQVVLTGAGTVSSKNVGSYSTANPGANTLDPTGLGLSDGNNGGLANNYTLVGGTDTLMITPATLSVVGTTVDTKPYDGNTAASLRGATLAGVLGGDTVTLGNDTTGTFATPNAGTGIGVTAGTMTIGGGDAGNYTLVQPSGLTGTITPAVLDLTGTRVYDGTTNAAASLFGNDGVLAGVNGETLTLAGTGTLSSKNVGTQQPFASNGLSGFTLTGNSTALAGNYTLAGGTDWVTITPLAITVDATGKDKTYDGTTVVGVTLGSSGVLAGDTVAFTDSSANFNSPNAGTGVPIAVTGITASGSDAGNYTFNTTASTSATISPYVLDLTGTRVYDATTRAYGGDFGTVTGLGGDTFTVSGTGAVSSKNVGSYSGVGGSGFDLGNLALTSSGTGLSSNYTLIGGTDQYTITPATLTVVGTTVGTKTYDGTTTASLSGATLTGVLGGDAVTLGNDTTGTFATPNAGTSIAVGTGMTISGGDAGNYVILQPTSLTGTINPYVLDLTGTRVYDGTTNAAASLFGNGGVLIGIDGQTVILSGTGQVGDKNVGTGKPFTSLGTLALSDGSNGGLGGNYTLVGGTDTLSITPKTIVVDATGTNKMYDGNTLDTVALGSGGVVAGDSVQFGYGTANFADPSIGKGILVTVTGVQLSGVDAGNYLLASPTVYTQADITGARASAFGISNGTLASVDSASGPMELATPYGLAPQDTVGPFTGNKKRLHRPVERNVSRGDFTSGLALKVVDGGLRVPVQAMP